MDRPTGGPVWIGGCEAAFRSPGDALRAGIAPVTEDRPGQRLIMDLAILFIAALPVLDKARRRDEVRSWIDEGDSTCVDPAAPTSGDTAHVVGLALDQDLSAIIPNDVIVGVGWGPTLSASLASFRPGAPRRRQGRIASPA